MGERTALINQLRAVLLERGIVMPQGRCKLERHVDALLAEEEIRFSARARLLIEDLHVEWRELDRRGPFFDCIQRYAQGFLSLMMQSTACMALHPVQERCCRWLLMTHDRVRSDQFHLSHEFLAMMLGSTRPTVTAVAGTLQRAGLIKYVHGRITILDRQRLEAASCECYSTVKKHFDRLGL